MRKCVLFEYYYTRMFIDQLEKSCSSDFKENFTGSFQFSRIEPGWKDKLKLIMEGLDKE